MQDKSLVPFIKGQIPPHISDSSSLLAPFLEAYYEWMHLPNNNYDLLNSLSDLHDIDKSLVKFSDEFQNEYLKNFPKDFITDKSLTIKHISDLYKAKGTPNAIKLLIKMILGKESEIFYPSTQLFKLSDGDWVQDNSILVKVISGNIFDIVGQSVKIVTGQLTFTSVIERVRLTDFDKIYEVFLERKLIYNITPNSVVSYQNVVLLSQSTVIDYKILKAGIGFKVGQLFEITSPNGKGCVAKVKSINDSGGIKSIQFIKFGYGYEADFISSISASSKNTNLIVQFPNLTDKIDGLSDGGFINSVDYYAPDYVDNTYVGTIVASFKSQDTAQIDGISASIEFMLGDKLKYPGYYNSINGFLSNNIYLQDSFYYQVYSYVIKIDDVIQKYKSEVLSTVHPAGLKLFGEYTIKNEFDLSTQLSFILNFFRTILLDNTQVQDVYSMTLSKIVSDNINQIDKSTITFIKSLIDSISAVDIPTKIFTKKLNDSLLSSDTANKLFTKSLIDSIQSNDAAKFNIILNKSDSVSMTDSFTIGFLLSKYINDAQFMSDSGGYLYLNYYTEPNYWSPDYSTGAVQF